MPDRAGALAIVVGGSVIAYSAFTRRSVIDTLLMKPIPAATSSDTDSTASGDNGTTDTVYGGLRGAIVAAAEKAVNEPAGTYTYDEIRPYPPNLYKPAPVTTDCSGFVTLCYKTAGAADPNGLGYSGQG
jgi:hypothetical protein